MSFIAPWMLWGVAAASIPIIIHLFFRSRYRKLPWAAMKFLLTSIEQVSRRLRFQELLLLVVRTLLLALLALALARPSTLAAAGSGGGDAVDAVLLMDVSYSMGAREGSTTRLERAKEAAASVIDRLPARSTVQVIACGDSAELLGPVAMSDLERARKIVGDVELSHLTTDLKPGVDMAAEALTRGHSPNKELYLFSDMQRTGWDRQAAALKEKLKEISEKATVYLVRCGAGTPRNVTLAGIASESGIPHTGDRMSFAVLVQNNGAEPVEDLTVTLEIEGRSKETETQAIASLSPGETQAVTLTGRLKRPGLRIITAAVSSDELEADNRLHKVLHVRERARILVVDGDPSGSRPEDASAFYLLHSLRPVPEAAWSAYHIQPRTVTPPEASPALLAHAEICILVNCALQPPGEHDPGALPAEFVDRLAGYVREGHGLLIFGGDRVSPEMYNAQLFEQGGLLPYQLLAAENAPEEDPLRPDPASISPKSFLAAFRDEPLSHVDRTAVRKSLGLREEEVDRSSVLLRYGNGLPAAAARKVGAGEVILITTTADQDWTDWPLRHTFLPFIHVTLGHLLGGKADAHNRTAGEPLRWHAPTMESSQPFMARSPSGRTTRLGTPKMVEGRPLVETPPARLGGIYRILPDEGSPVANAPVEETPKREDSDPVIFAVAPNTLESEDLDALNDSQIDERLGFTVVHLSIEGDVGALAGTERLRREWTLWLLLAMLLLVLFEVFLAWYCTKGW